MKKAAIKLLVGAGLLAGIMFHEARAADTFPTRPITLVVPYTAGGPVDIHFRMLMAQLEKILGVPFVLENKPGAGATLGPATVAATAKPDGYTLTELPAGIFSVPVMQKVSFDPAKDFTYIIGMSGYRLMGLVHPDAPWKTFKDLVADAKAHPATIIYGSTGPGAVVHLAVEQVSIASGMKLRQIPFRGTSEVVAAFLGGHVQMVMVAGNFLNLVDSGQARPIFYFAKQRSTRFPDVPTLTDEGLETPLDLSFPYGLGGPKGMDPEVVKILHDAFKKAMDTPEHAKVLEQLDQPLVYMNSEDYRAFALRQIAAYRTALTGLGLARKD